MDKFKFYVNSDKKENMTRFYFILDKYKYHDYDYLAYYMTTDYVGYSKKEWIADISPYLLQDKYIKEFDLKHKFIKGIFSDDFERGE